MALKELLGKVSKVIEIEGVAINVKPLSLKHVGDLLDSHREELKGLFNASKGMRDILVEMPALAYNVISMSTGEEVSDIEQLPIGIQLQLLEAVVDASQISSDAVGKLIGRLVRGAQTTLGKQVSTLTSGKKVSKEHLKKSLDQATASQT